MEVFLDQEICAHVVVCAVLLHLQTIPWPMDDVHHGGDLLGQEQEHHAAEAVGFMFLCMCLDHGHAHG